MQHFYRLQDVNLQDAWLTVGAYDGVHLGHQTLLNQLTAGARAANAPAVVLTFFPHPSMVLGEARDSFYLSMPEEKAELLDQFGVDITITHPFDLDVAKIKAGDFIKTLHERLGFRKFIVGHDFAFGRDREGDLPSLKTFGEVYGFEVIPVSPFLKGGEVVSSSRIRRLLDGGEVEAAAELLGRPFFVRGRVVEGEGRGRRIGVPTANLDLPKARAVPKAGVYACRATHQGKTYPAVTNVGVRPTFETEPVAPRVETHILDVNLDLYGEQLDLAFLHRLRDEQRFEGVEALSSQIQRDIAAARQLLSR